jgi:DNA-binding GntR family transcriptional regulator
MLDSAKPPRYDQAYEALRDMIVSGRLRAGETVSEVQLAEALGVSRTPVREAVRRLVGLGLLEATPRGLRIFRPTAEDVAEVYFMRAAIEGALVRAAAGRITPEQVDVLRTIHAESERAAARADIASLVVLNGQFHSAIATAAGSPRSTATLRDLEPLVASYRRLSLLAPGHQAASIADHARLIGLLARRDGQGAEALMREHIADAGRRVAEAVAQIEPMGGGALLANLNSLTGRIA